MRIPSLTDIRKIEWAKSYQWYLYFPIDYAISGVSSRPPDPPVQFQEWFPSSNIVEPVYSVKSSEVSSSFPSLQIPSSFSYSDMTVTFNDDNKHSIREWLHSWVFYMFGLENYTAQDNSDRYLGEAGVGIGRSIYGVRPVIECIRPVLIGKYDNTHNLIYERCYYVWPSGNLSETYGSESSPVSDQITFTVVSGIYSKSYQN